MLYENCIFLFLLRTRSNVLYFSISLLFCFVFVSSVLVYNKLAKYSSKLFIWLQKWISHLFRSQIKILQWFQFDVEVWKKKNLLAETESDIISPIIYSLTLNDYRCLWSRFITRFDSIEVIILLFFFSYNLPLPLVCFHCFELFMKQRKWLYNYS